MLLFMKVTHVSQDCRITGVESNAYWFLFVYMLEVIIDYRSAFVTYRNEIESKGVQFPGRDASDKISRGG